MNLLSIISGAALAFALPPYYFLPGLFGFSALFFALEKAESGKGAFRAGWLCGFVQFVIGLYWIKNALLTDSEKFGWMVPFAVAGLPAVLGCFTGLASFVYFLVSRSLSLCLARKIALLPCCWFVAEFLRSFVLSGFPWNLSGYSLGGVFELSQFASVAGVWGLGWLAAVAGLLPVMMWRKSRISLIVMAAIAVIYLWGGYRAGSGPVSGGGANIRIVQPNISQFHKWEPLMMREIFIGNLELASSGRIAADAIVVWPETAVPYPLNADVKALAMIGKATPEKGVTLAGALTYEKGAVSRVWNSLFAVGPKGDVRAAHDKFHLVPFGEYVPLRDFLPVKKITHGDLSFSSGPGPRTIKLSGFPSFSPLICYESIFPDNVISGERPDFLLNITNDAWFGDSAGPRQHLAMAKMRAVEQGLPLVRAANTGISAVIDPFGREVQILDLGQRGVIDGILPGKTVNKTTYSRLGYFLILLWVYFCGLFITTKAPRC